MVRSQRENENANAREQIAKKNIGGNKEPCLKVVRRIGRKKENIDRPIFVQFAHLEDKEKLICSGKCNTDSLTICSNIIFKCFQGNSNDT